MTQDSSLDTQPICLVTVKRGTISKWWSMFLSSSESRHLYASSPKSLHDCQVSKFFWPHHCQKCVSFSFTPLSCFLLDSLSSARLLTNYAKWPQVNSSLSSHITLWVKLEDSVLLLSINRGSRRHSSAVCSATVCFT